MRGESTNIVSLSVYYTILVEAWNGRQKVFWERVRERRDENMKRAKERKTVYWDAEV